MSYLEKVPWSKVNYVLKGILVGAIAGAVVSAFRMVIHLLLDSMPEIYAYLRENPLWLFGWILLVFLVVVIIIILVRDEPNIQGNGMAELKGQLRGTLRLDWLSVLWRKFLGSSLVLGLGIPVGQEGPSIQIGGVVGQGLNKFMKGNKSQENIFISSGAAAGLAAAFNAPLSAFVLVLEEIHHRFSNVLILSVFSASITASFVAFRIFGSEPAIGLGPTIFYPLENYFYLFGLGLILGVGAWFFQEGIFSWTPAFYAKLPIPRYLHAFLPFILLIPIGLYWTEMLGGGTNLIMMLASERLPTMLLLMVLLFRFIVFNLSFGSGIPGGTLVPSLVFGAIIGALYGNIFLETTGLEDIYVRNFVIYGMGGFFTATTKAPLTGIVLITELTGSMNQLTPISIVSLTAYIISDMLRIEPADEITLYNKTKFYPTIFEGKLTYIDFVLDHGSILAGEKMLHLELPHNAKVVKIKRNDFEFLPHKEIVLQPNDELTISCDAGFVDMVSRFLDKVNEE